MILFKWGKYNMWKKFIRPALIFLSVYSLSGESYALSVRHKQDSTAAVFDTAAIAVKADSLAKKKRPAIIPLPKEIRRQTPSRYIDHSEVSFNYHNYAGDLLNYSPAVFTRYQGQTGNPHETTVYGEGFGNVSYMQDGVLLNSRLTNVFYLSDIQTGNIDSIEVVRAPRGFMYGVFSNSAAVNFITRSNPTVDSSKLPYTRIKYYQAPGEEAMINFMYNSYITRNFIVSAEITNQKKDSTTSSFFNEEFWTWMASTSLRYMPDNKTNIIFSYDFLHDQTHTNFGLDRDSVFRMARRDAGSFYDQIKSLAGDAQAPVISKQFHEKVISHKYTLRMLNEISDALSTRAALYYQKQEDEYGYGPGSMRNNDYANFGFLAEVTLRQGISELTASAGYDNIDTDAYFISGGRYLFASGLYSMKLMQGRLIPSVYAKYTRVVEDNYTGWGADVRYRISGMVSVYLGASGYKRTPALPMAGSRFSGYITNAEAGIDYKTPGLQAELSFSYIKNRDMLWYNPLADYLCYVSDDVYRKTYSVSLKLDARYGKMLFESTSAMYYSWSNYPAAVAIIDGRPVLNNTERRMYLMPEYVARMGLYYTDVMFDNSLRLKTGFSASLTGMQNEYYYDREYPQRKMLFTVGATPELVVRPAAVLNYVLTAQIRERAVIYLRYENLTDEKYYITPYYIMPERGMRLGVSWEFLN